MTKLEELQARIREFSEVRDWRRFNSPANLAKSISIEASELLECFQWSDEGYDREHVLEELADVMIYCLHMVDILGVDVIDILNHKVDLNEEKYPIEKAKALVAKYDKL